MTSTIPPTIPRNATRATKAVLRRITEHASVPYTFEGARILGTSFGTLAYLYAAGLIGKRMNQEVDEEIFLLEDGLKILNL
jgi:hypothetical protein